jgi:hypothetical protein
MLDLLLVPNPMKMLCKSVVAYIQATLPSRAKKNEVMEASLLQSSFPVFPALTLVPGKVGVESQKIHPYHRGNLLVQEL